MEAANNLPDFSRRRIVANPSSKLFNPPGCGDTEDRIKEVVEQAQFRQSQRKRNLGTCISIIFEVIVLIIVLISIFSTAPIKKLEDVKLGYLNSYFLKKFALITVIAHLFSYGVMSIIVKITRKLRGTGRLYLLNATENTITCVLWFSLVLAAWTSVLESNVKISERNEEMSGNLQKGIVCVVLATALWLVKLIWMKKKVISFTKDRYYDDIITVLSAQCIIRCLVVDQPYVIDIMNTTREIVVGEHEKFKGEKELWVQMPFEEWENLNRYSIPASTMRRFMKIIRYTTLDDELQQLGLEYRAGRTSGKEIAIHLSDTIFEQASIRNPEWINLDDLASFMPATLAREALQAIATPDSDTISRVDLRRWLVRSLRMRRRLEINLSNNHKVMKNIDRIVSCVVFVFTLSCSFYIMNKTATKKFFEVLLAQSAIMVLCCNHMVTMYQQCLRYFLTKHPINVGDVCYIEGEWMIAQEVNLLDTNFLTEHNRTLTLENTILLPQYVHVAKHVNVWIPAED